MTVLATVAVLAVVGAVLGYTTKWTSVQLIFHPSTYVGIGPIGWQGVIQRRSPKFALGVADTLRSVAPLEEIVDRLDAQELAALATAELRDRLDVVAPQVLDQIVPGWWEQAPEHVRQALASMLRSEVTAVLADVIDEVKALVPGLIDLDALSVELLAGENADRLARLVAAIGDRDLKVLIRYGAVVGFVVGLLEAAAYLLFHAWWLLPAIGALDGLFNNWMGIRMIFRPLEPRRYLGVFRYHGLFPARQAEIARTYSTMMADEVLTPAALAARLGDPVTLAPLLKIAHDVLDRRLAPQLAALAPNLGVEATPELTEKAINATLVAVAGSGITAAELPRTLTRLQEQLQIQTSMEQELRSMDRLEFERILRGIFEEDERLLIGIGGAIGALIGCLQAGLVVALHLG